MANKKTICFNADYEDWKALKIKAVKDNLTVTSILKRMIKKETHS